MSNFCPSCLQLLIRVARMVNIIRLYAQGRFSKREVSYTLGEVVLRENRFWYCDLIPD